MPFMIKNDHILSKYNEIWDKIKETLSIEFHSKPVYDKKYIKTKVREFGSVIKTNFLGNGIPKENMHYICIACITINSVKKIEKKNHPQVHLEECKYKAKKLKMSRLINVELKSDFESDLEIESIPDTELMTMILNKILLLINMRLFSEN